MHIFKFTAFASVFVYALLIDWTLLMIQLAILAVYYVFSWIISKKHFTSIRKKTSLATWNSPGDPSVFNNLEVDASLLDAFIEKYNSSNPDSKISYTHIGLKAMGYALKSVKNLNSTIAFGNFVPIDDIDISCLVDVGGVNLATMVVKKCDKSSVSEIKTQMNGKVAAYKKKKDGDFNKQMSIINSFHSSIVGFLLEVSSFVSYAIGREIKVLRIKKNSFGTALFTNVSSMEIYNSFAPLVPFTKAMCVVLMCKPRMRAMVDENGSFVAKKIMNINVTFDHRYCDGVHASVIIKNMYYFFKNLDLLAQNK